MEPTKFLHGFDCCPQTNSPNFTQQVGLLLGASFGNLLFCFVLAPSASSYIWMNLVATIMYPHLCKYGSSHLLPKLIIVVHGFYLGFAIQLALFFCTKIWEYQNTMPLPTSRTCFAFFVIRLCSTDHFMFSKSFFIFFYISCPSSPIKCDYVTSLG